MRFPAWAIIPILLLAAGQASAAATYDLRENVSVGQTFRVQMDNHRHLRSSTTTAGKTTRSDIQYRQFMISTITVLAEENGSATQIRVKVDPDSHNSQTDSGGMKLIDCSFAGQTVTLRRRSDESVANDFAGQPDPNDLDNLNSLLDPDADFYPDHPVAVGEVWDVSAKVSRHAGLGPNDQLMAQCRLDSVSNIDGKEIAQLSCSCGTILQEEGNLEEDMEWTATMQVDIAKGEITYSDLKGTSTFSTPASEPTVVTGGTVFHCESKILPTPSAQ
ncbi:MAG: hypothetical protein ABSF29_04575 [Tepidisphaeraceae bacterium]|jgi:hypothetical protein